MPKTLHSYRCANKLVNGEYCDGTRFAPNVNGIDKPFGKLARNDPDVGARCNKCGRIYSVEDVQTAFDHGFDFFSNPL
jgi:predicted adenine nucleotide alpha hydrolase (AANH) superfamily ATPase